jgi:hypothetical protein
MRVTKLLVFFFLILFAAVTKAQDTIHMRSGELIVAKVTNVGTTDIKYKKWGHLDGPKYDILQSDVAFITYHDGSKDVFKASAPPAGNTPASPTTPPAGPYTIMLNYNPNTSYSVLDSTVNFMAKLRLGMGIEWSWGFLTPFSATYTDLHNGFMLSAYTAFDGLYGLDGTFYFLKSDKMKMSTIPFTYMGEHYEHTYYTINHNIEKINYLGLHLGYYQRELSNASLGWYSYYHTDITSISQFLGNGTNVPLYHEIAIGPQYVSAIAYRATLNDGSNMVAVRRTIFTTGFDLLMYPSTPVLDAKYDSLANAQLNNNTTYSSIPSSIFSNSGLRLYFKIEFGWSKSNFDWGLDFEGAIEENLAGFGWMEKTGLYFGL